MGSRSGCAPSHRRLDLIEGLIVQFAAIPHLQHCSSTVAEIFPASARLLYTLLSYQVVIVNVESIRPSCSHAHGFFYSCKRTHAHHRNDIPRRTPIHARVLPLPQAFNRSEGVEKMLHCMMLRESKTNRDRRWLVALYSTSSKPVGGKIVWTTDERMEAKRKDMPNQA